MRLPRLRLSERRIMAWVAVLAVVLGLLILAYREASRQINVVESEYYHRRAREETNPGLKAEWVKRAKQHDHLILYYGFGW